MAKKKNADIETIVSQGNELVANCDRLLPIPQIEKMIFTFRGVQVMFDRDLAQLYGVTTSSLNEQVKRNIRRFPEAFRFQITAEERDKDIGFIP